MENVKEFAEYATTHERACAMAMAMAMAMGCKLTCAQYARRVPQGGHSLHEPLHQYDYHYLTSARLTNTLQSLTRGSSSASRKLSVSVS